MTEVHEVMFTLYIRLPSHTLTYSHPHTLTPSHPHRATGGELFRVIAIDPLPEDRAINVVPPITTVTTVIEEQKQERGPLSISEVELAEIPQEFARTTI